MHVCYGRCYACPELPSLHQIRSALAYAQSALSHTVNDDETNAHIINTYHGLDVYQTLWSSWHLDASRETCHKHGGMGSKGTPRGG